MLFFFFKWIDRGMVDSLDTIKICQSVYQNDYRTTARRRSNHTKP